MMAAVGLEVDEMIALRYPKGRTALASSAVKVLALALLILPIATAANGSGLRPLPTDRGLKRMVVPVAMRCARIVKDGGRESIYNTCGTCRIVSITRKRTGIALPVSRTFNVQPRSSFPTPFRGNGRSRITNEQACEGSAGAARNLVKPKPLKNHAQNQCVEVRQSISGGVILVNTCNTCRGAAIQRLRLDGKPMGMQVYKLAGQSIQPVTRKGAAKVGLVGEVPCLS